MSLSSLGYSQHVTTYEYDEAGRLVKKNTSSGHERRYDFDRAGNRTQATSKVPNIPPVAVNDSYTMDQGQSIVVTLTTNDTDADGPQSALQVLSLDNIQHTTHPAVAAEVTLLSDGRVEIFAYQGGGVSFDYIVSDGEDIDEGRVVVDIEGEPVTCGGFFCAQSSGFLKVLDDLLSDEAETLEEVETQEKPQP